MKQKLTEEKQFTGNVCRHVAMIKLLDDNDNLMTDVTGEVCMYATMQEHPRADAIDKPYMCDEVQKQTKNRMDIWLKANPWHVEYLPIDSLLTFLEGDL